MTAFLIIVLLLLFIWWNIRLPFYKDRRTAPLEADEDKVFSESNRSYIHEEGSGKAVLFIHGFPTTPSMYEYPRKFFSEHGYDVYAPLIPTFGADFKDFQETCFSQWFDYIRKQYEKISSTHDKTYVVGVSMGGAMTLKLAEVFKPEAIAVLAAPVTYNSLLRDGIVTSYPAYLVRTIALFRKNIAARIVDGRPGGEDGEEEWRGYGGLFPRQGLSLIHNLKSIRRDLSRITCPALLIHDKGDRTVPFGNLKLISEGISSSHIEIIESNMRNFKHSHHSLLMYDSTREEYTQRIYAFFEKIVEGDLK